MQTNRSKQHLPHLHEGLMLFNPHIDRNFQQHITSVKILNIVGFKLDIEKKEAINTSAELNIIG